MVRVLPVERAAVAEENLLALQQVQGELLVIGNVEALNINLREQVERAVRTGAADAVNLVEHLVCQGALLVQAAAGNDQLVNGLVAAERGLDGVLCRNVGAQAHGSEQVNAFQVACCVLLRAGDSNPTCTVTADAVCLGQAGEGQAEHVVAGEGCHVDGFSAVVGDLFVDFIGEHDQAVLACQVHDLLQNRARVDGTGRVVRVNDHDALGALGNLRLDVFDVRVPVVFLIAEVVHGLAAYQRGGCGPQRVVGHGDQDFVAGLAERLQGHRD